MKKEDLVVGQQYCLETLTATLVGYDEKGNDPSGKVILKPENEETKEFYRLISSGEYKGCFYISTGIFVECFDPKN